MHLEALVDHKLLVNGLKDARFARGSQVSRHVVEYEINVLVVARLEDILQANDVLVACQPLQIHDLTKGALRVCCILEGPKDLLDRNCRPRLLVDGLVYDGVRPLPKLLLDIVLAQNGLIDGLLGCGRHEQVRVRDPWSIVCAASGAIYCT